jgi:hypothetical protein
MTKNRAEPKGHAKSPEGTKTQPRPADNHGRQPHALQGREKVY